MNFSGFGKAFISRFVAQTKPALLFSIKGTDGKTGQKVELVPVTKTTEQLDKRYGPRPKK
jgi:hypothetical protein